LLGLFELHAHRRDAARNAFTVAVQLRPRDPVAFWLLGSAALDLGDTTAAINACETALALKPAAADLSGIARDLTAALRRAGRAAELASVWSRIEALDPDNLRLCEQAATALRNAELPEQALLRYQRLAEELDDPWRRNQSRLAAADIKRQLGQTRQALADEEAILDELDPDSWQARQVLDRIEDALLKTGQTDDLLRLLNQRLDRSGYQVELVQRVVRLLRLRDRTSEALQLLEQQLTVAPQDRSLRMLLIAEYTRSGRTADAADQYRSLETSGLLRPADREAWGQLLLSEQTESQSPAARVQQAAAIWRGGLTDASTSTELRRVAELLRGPGLAAAALPLLQQAVSRDPADARAREQLGSCLHALGQRDQALSEWRGLVAGDRRSPEAFRELSSILRAHGEHRAAIEALSDACEVLPTVSDLLRLASAQLEFREGTSRPLAASSLTALSRAAAAADTFADWQRVVEQQAATLQQLGQLDNALQQLRDSSTTSQSPSAALPAPSLQLPPDLVTRLHLALLERAAGNVERALGAVQQALAAAPTAGPVLQLAAELTAAAGMPAAALQLREQLLQHDSRGRVAHLAALMTLSRQQGLHANAGDYARQLLQAAPEDPAMLTAAAEVLVECGRSDTAAAALEAALRRQPDDSATALALASLLAEQNQTSRALDVCRSALVRVTDERARTEIARLLAELHQQLGRPPELLQWFEEQIAQAEDLQRGHWLRSLAEVHKASGQTALASRALERALRIDGPATSALLELSELALRQQDPVAATAALQQINTADLDPAASRQLLDLALRAGAAGQATLRMIPGLSRLETADHISLLDRLLQQRRFSDAREVAELLLQAGRESWEVRLRLAVAHSRSGDLEKAAATCLQLLQSPQPLETLAADAVRSRPGKNRPRIPAGVDAANPEAWDHALENSARIFLDLSPQRDPDVFSEGWCESFAVARLLAVTALLLAEDTTGTVAANASPPATAPPVSARPEWDAWVRSQLRSVVQGQPLWSLTDALQLSAARESHADAAVLGTAIQLFAPLGSRPLTDIDGRWLGIHWRATSERRRQRVRPPDPLRLEGLQTAFRSAAARGDLHLCEHSAAAIAAACQHAEQLVVAQQLLVQLQRDSASPTELLAAIFLQRAVSEFSKPARFSMEVRLQMLDRVLSVVPAVPPEVLPAAPEAVSNSTSVDSLLRSRTRALQLPIEWLQQLPAGDSSAADRRLLCHWWLRQPGEGFNLSAPAPWVLKENAGGRSNTVSIDTTAASAEVAFHSRCGQLLQMLLPAEERELLLLLVQQMPQEAVELAESAAVAAEHPLRAAILLAAAANQSADLPKLLTAAEQLLTLLPQSPAVVFLAADCRQRAGLFAEARELLRQLPAGLPAQSRQRSFRLLELATLLRDTPAVDAAALELAGMELASAERSQLLSLLRISGTPSLLLELQQRQTGVAVTASSADGLLQQLQQQRQTGGAAAAVPLARQIVSSEAGRGQGGVRFRRQPNSAAVQLREQAWDVLRDTGELDRWIEQQQKSLRDAPDSAPLRRQLADALQAAGRTAEAAEMRANPGQPLSPASAPPAAPAPATVPGKSAEPARRSVPDLISVAAGDPDWLGSTWPACGPLPVRVIHQRLQAALMAVSSEYPEEGFEQLLGIEEQDAVRAAAWLAMQTPPGDPISLSALQRLAVTALTPAGIQRLAARRIQQLRENIDPGPAWTGTRALLSPNLLSATARRGSTEPALLQLQRAELQNLSPEDRVLAEVLSALLSN
ncbi:MAG: tetratricopeptide repeat protein, partial [Planctomycetaceae bacterium]